MEGNTRNNVLARRPRPPMIGDRNSTHGVRIAGGVEGILTRLFNLLCLDVTGGRGISPVQWNKLMIEYIRAMVESNTTMDRSSIRGNMNKELRKPSMTWNVLCKGLRFLKFEAFTVSVDGELYSGKKFNAYTSVSFVPESKFAHLFPEELPRTIMVRKKESKNRRAPAYSSPSGYGKVLSLLFNLICSSVTDGEGFSQAQWNAMLTAFIGDAENDMGTEQRTNVRSKQNKEFRLPKMTWKVFCKSLRFLQVSRFTIHITAYRDDGVICECETPINFAPRK